MFLFCHLQLMERNAVMLEETKDTITVPAAFMIRMLACIHSLRNRRTTVRAAPDADVADANQVTSNESNNVRHEHDNDDFDHGESNRM